eukprot:tig00020713_g13402.t1
MPPPLPPRKPPTPKTPGQDARQPPVKPSASTSSVSRPPPSLSRSASGQAEDSVPVGPIQSALAGLDPSQPPAALIQACEALWSLIEPLGDQIRERGPGQRRESVGDAADGGRGEDTGGAILKVVYRLMDQKEPRLLAKLCRIILRVTRSSSSVLNTCRVLYKLSKEDRNDALFREEGLLEELLSLARDPRYSGAPDSSSNSDEIMLYAAGAMKNASNDDANAKHILQKGGVSALGFVLTTRCAALSVRPRALPLPRPARRAAHRGAAAAGGPAAGGAGAGRPGSASGGERVAQLLVQVTATVRNLAAQPLGGVQRRHFLAGGVVDALLALAGLLPGHADAMLNVSRVLSKLTLYEECRAAVARYPDGTRRLLALLGRHADNAALVTRVCFVLGNLTTASEEQRLLLGGPLAAPDAPPGERPLQPPQVRETEEALVKIIRLVANLSMEAGAGARVAARPEVEELARLLERKTIAGSEELVLNAVSAVTNLSFYLDAPGNRVTAARCRLARLLVPLLLSFNEEAVVEALRAFGNFSRHEDARAALAEERVGEIGALLLDHGARDVVYWAAGVLLNLASDARHRALLRDCAAVDRLLDALGRFGAQDYAVSATVCKALANYCMGHGAGAGLTGEEAASLLGLVEDLSAAAAGAGGGAAGHGRGTDTAQDAGRPGSRPGSGSRAPPAPGRPPSRGRGSSGEEDGAAAAGAAGRRAGRGGGRGAGGGAEEFLAVASDLAGIVRQLAGPAAGAGPARRDAASESPPPQRELVPLEYHSDGSSRTDRSTG